MSPRTAPRARSSDGLSVMTTRRPSRKSKRPKKVHSVETVGCSPARTSQLPRCGSRRPHTHASEIFSSRHPKSGWPQACGWRARARARAAAVSRTALPAIIRSAGEAPRDHAPARAGCRRVLTLRARVCGPCRRLWENPGRVCGPCRRLREKPGRVCGPCRRLWENPGRVCGPCRRLWENPGRVCGPCRRLWEKPGRVCRARRRLPTRRRAFAAFARAARAHSAAPGTTDRKTSPTRVRQGGGARRGGALPPADRRPLPAALTIRPRIAHVVSFVGRPEARTVGMDPAETAAAGPFVSGEFFLEGRASACAR
jgi:hypothetical protein